MPYFCLQATDGKLYSNSSFKDALTTLICFTSNHCPYAQGYQSRLLKIAEEYTSSGLKMAFIMSNDGSSYPEDSYEKMLEKKLPFPYLHDVTQGTAKAFGAEATPEVFIFDRDQKLRFHGGIDDSPKDESNVTQKYAEDAIKALLTGNDVIKSEVPFIGCSIKWAIS
jgi:hypothetical protein